MQNLRNEDAVFHNSGIIQKPTALYHVLLVAIDHADV